MKAEFEELQEIANYLEESKLYDHQEVILNAIQNLKEMEKDLKWYKERVVWVYYGDSIPHYAQGSSGEYKDNKPVTAEEIRNIYKALNIYKRERERYRHAKPEITGEYFLAGGHGRIDDNLLPEFVEIVPAYGCAWSQVYKKTDRTISSEGS